MYLDGLSMSTNFRRKPRTAFEKLPSDMIMMVVVTASQHAMFFVENDVSAVDIYF